MSAKRRRKRPRRNQSFLGIHFDLDAGHGTGRIGRCLTRPMVRSIIKTVRPDYIQCDAKGIGGLSWYPTEVGFRAPGLVRDPLRIWRDVTAARGVALYACYSGIRDRQAVKRRRAWARVGPDGKPDGRTVSVFGTYVEELLLPQLKELAGRYGLDGAWMDGECLSLEPDYARAVARAFRKETGLRRAPTKPTHKHWVAFAEFCREGFRRYLRHYVDEVHAAAPEFQVGSSGAFSHLMPEPVTAGVDFLTADVPPVDSVNAARLAGRALAGQGKPWDLRLDSSRRRPGQACASTKTAEQLKQEAAVVVALGGGVSVRFPQKRDGSIYDWQMALMAEVARFCRQRRPFCHRAEPVPQVALLYSGAAYYRSGPGLMRPSVGQLEPVQGILQALLGLHYPVEVAMEHHLAGRMDAYPLIVVPEWASLETDLRDALLAYVAGGGSLLVVGPASAGLFADALGVTLAGDEKVREQWLAFDGRLAAMETVSAPVRLKGGARAIGRLHDENDARGKGRPAASVIEFGEGRIAATYLNLGERFLHAATSVARRFLDALVRELFPRPLVEVQGEAPVDVIPGRVGGQLAVNLVNTGGPHADANVDVFDRVPPLGPLKVRIRTDRRPERVLLQPDNRHVPFRFRDGSVEFELPRLEIHEVVMFEEAGSD